MRARAVLPSDGYPPSITTSPSSAKAPSSTSGRPKDTYSGAGVSGSWAAKKSSSISRIVQASVLRPSESICPRSAHSGRQSSSVTAVASLSAKFRTRCRVAWACIMAAYSRQLALVGVISISSIMYLL